MVIDKGSRTFLIECIIFQDHTFEIAINDITQQEQESRLKRQLTQNIAHELKTPVSSIRGYMETILSTEMDDSRKKMFMERCYAQSKRLTDLLRDISMLNRLDESKDLYDTDNTDLQRIASGLDRTGNDRRDEKPPRTNVHKWKLFLIVLHFQKSYRQCHSLCRYRNKNHDRLLSRR